VIYRCRKPTDLAIVSVGSCDYAISEAIDRLAEHGIYLNYIRVKAFPFGDEVTEFLGQHERVFVVEQNRDAQLKSLLTLETDYPKNCMTSVLNYSGLPIDCRCIVAAIEQAVAEGMAA
ncbi:MAG: 2-oxoacid:acceptor oxidoreductase subunit alpha, partial [Gammaproteobacteria bacterium]|nr:2-oxoacid:acceptor oxidoreductase subunit alpha [Gammaproteobacteria bacterium]